MDIEIIKFSDEYSKYFTDLNMAWLQKYFVVEPIDHEILSNPKKHILGQGGFIFFAKVNKQIAVGNFIQNDLPPLMPAWNGIIKPDRGVTIDFVQ